ncbi:hypothetical protein ACIP98_30890 [Streptomyces sp. NPDC088354]|uniref:hypothetical protein n=1 Tax=Streptomyces sp. NPDC088354 TaxID=3365856 RepID=UPI0038196168
MESPQFAGPRTRDGQAGGEVMAAVGRWPPASGSSTRTRSSSDMRPAITLPAVPPPTTTTS